MSHYKPYPAYKDSGVEWLGRVPEHWGVRKLKWLASLQSGDFITSETIEEEGTYPVYGGNGLRGYSTAFTHEGAYALVGRQGALCGNINYAEGKFWASEHAVVVSPYVPTAVRWLGELLRAMNLGQYSISSAQPGLAVERIIDLFLPVPPEGERQIIAAHMGRETARIDALIEKKTRFIELLREKRQALITHAVTKGLDPKVKMKDSGVEWLGEVPEHWAVKRLKFIAAVQTGIAKGKDNAEKDTVEVPYLRVANVQDGYLDLDEVATIEVSTSDLPRYLLQPGDVLMNEGGDFDKLGRGHVWHGEIEPCIHQNHVFAVRPHGVSSEWLNTFTSSAAAQFYFMGRSKQSTNLASISSSNLMELAVPLPSEEEQRLILDGLHRQAAQVNALVARTERSIELLKERRSALITAAVTGQIDLREAE
ncbi:restriction endonuclease subunit S [Pseudomonas aeruginosa]|uniref:restriction endonuclease subunit S n=1 Tax=Pseudomonas aeruginosa TaxID=287 RepID=UPI00070A0488|nr:restriction endonuclease subunit S [Pseudomonas aeruginosa]